MDIRKITNSLLESYSYLLFSNSPTIGALLLLLSFINVSAGVHAIVAFIAAFLFAQVISENRTAPPTLFLYNSLLIGLAIGYLFDISILSLLFTVVAGILTFLASSSFHNTLAHYFKLPILNLPFAIIAILVYIATLQYSSLFQANSAIN